MFRSDSSKPCAQDANAKSKGQDAAAPYSAHLASGTNPFVTGGSKRESARSMHDHQSSAKDGIDGTSAAPQATSLAAYSSETAVDTFLSNLAGELSMIAEQPAAIFKSSEVDSSESLGQALDVLNSTLRTLADVQSRATRHVSFLSVCILRDIKRRAAC